MFGCSATGGDGEMHKIKPGLASELYSKNESGIIVLRDYLDAEKLEALCKVVEQNMEKFEIKREKVIANNQRVSLIYRGPFKENLLSGTPFSIIFDEYMRIRSAVNDQLDNGFLRGSSIEAKLIHYPVSEMGVDVHKDLSSNINLIVFFNLSGRANVQTFSDKAKSNPVDHLMGPGDVSLMRAPLSVLDDDLRPYHAVVAVPEPRNVLVIREINDVLERETNKDNWMGF